MRNKSSFTPEPNRDLNLDTFIKEISDYPIIPEPKAYRKKNKKHINKQECESLENLTNDKGIIIKEADKGGTTVIMNTEFYERK